MTDEQLPQEVTKRSFRKKIWDYMTKNELANFPLSLKNCIPNFKGAAEAAQRLAELEEFKTAKIVKINPDISQEPVRTLALEANKEILVPIPRLSYGLFLHVTPIGDATKDQLKTSATWQGLLKHGKPLGIDAKIKVDLVVLGSVCVSRDGYRLGKGEGFADLEFAMMMRMGAVTQDTIVVTTVHDCQIVGELPPQIFKQYDVPVDIIVTPTQTIIVNPRLKKPDGIIWELLSQRKINTMQILQQLKEMDEKDGKVIVLKETDSDTETHQSNKKRSRHQFNKRNSNSQKKKTNKEEVLEEVDNNKAAAKPRPPRKRSNRKSREAGDNNPPSVETQGKEEGNEKSTTKRPKNSKHKSKSYIDFSLKLSNIPHGVRVRDLKNTLMERGVKPCEIIWHGHGRGICYLHFSKLRSESSTPDQPVQVDSIVANLQQLRIGDFANSEADYIVVEPAKPISRIEVTDVTSV